MKETTMLEGLTPPQREAICVFYKNARDTLSAKDLKILDDSLADVRWSNVGLAKELTQRGFKCYDEQVRFHRTGKCACVR
jgi:hypothetical protein